MFAYSQGMGQGNGNGVEVFGGATTIDELTVTVRNCNGYSISPVFEDLDITYSYNGCCGPGSGNNPHPQIGSDNGNPHDDVSFFIELLPNPAQNHVTVKFPSGGNSKNIRVIDSYGNERKNINTISASLFMDVSDLQLGVYTVIVTDGIDITTEHLQILP